MNSGSAIWSKGISFLSYRLFLFSLPGLIILSSCKTEEKKIKVPDNKPAGTIAFNMNRDGNKEIYLMDAKGSNLRNITRDTLDCYSPSWSPDGKWIAYTAGTGNNYDIYIINIESSEKRRLTNTKKRNESPAWAPVSLEE